MSQISVTVNGVQRNSEVESRLLLVEYLRDALDLTGTHLGCDTSGPVPILLAGGHCNI